MKLFNLTIIRICIVLILGILTGFYFDIPPTSAFVSLGISLVIFLLAFLKTRSSIFPEVYFGLSIYLLLYILGANCAVINKPENQAGHYFNLSPDIQQISTPLSKLRITERLKPGAFNDRYIAEVEVLTYRTPDSDSIYSANTHGKILLNIERDSSSRELHAGNRLLTAFSPTEIREALNPHQFDYKEYMSNLGVKGQLQLTPAKIQITKSNKTDLIADFRKSIITQLKRQNFSADEMGIIQALLLGQRQEVSKQVYEDYAAAGAIHILAVSGLHVGILLLILNFLFSPLDRNRHTKTMKAALLLLLLWGFAALAGFSASVVRAVAMFSFIAIGMQLNRRTSIMNSLFTSLFILLLINPLYIFQAGFQLSYLAVFSIIVFYKPIRSIYSPRFKLDRYIRDLLAVSISAQIGVLPLSLYYFHQFPGLFFITNLVVLPFLGVIICFGLLIITLALFGMLPAILAGLFGKVISMLNSFVTFIANREEFLFSEIHFSAANLVSAYILILTLLFWLYKRTAISLIFFLIGIILLQTSYISDKLQVSPEAFIFHETRESIITIKKNRQLLVYRSRTDRKETEHSVKAYQLFHNIETNHSQIIENVLVFRNKKLLVIDSTGFYDQTVTSPDLVLLRDSPKINLERLIANLKPEKIIADGSNYKSYVRRWERTCNKEKVPFHHTGEKGAFQILADQ
ncbi:ComEC/Rec2 family competence protein [Salegentibacter chungangensis]|uniref:ComEC/Rec2 family competence protein n=1 Tax=Salegentibacter chungangensis TaxID=1335724 RepID=A0ABW3NMV1_9FLAO